MTRKSVRGAIAQYLFTTFGVGGGCLGILFLLLIGPLVFGWALMLGFGIVHNDISSAVAPIGYWPSVVLGWVLGFIGAKFRGGGSK